MCEKTQKVVDEKIIKTEGGTTVVEPDRRTVYTGPTGVGEVVYESPMAVYERARQLGVSKSEATADAKWRRRQNGEF